MIPAASRPLRWREKAILGFVEQFCREHQRPPSYREIQEGCDLSSVSVVAYNLHALEGRGLLQLGRDGVTTRAIRLVRDPHAPCPFCGEAPR